MVIVGQCNEPERLQTRALKLARRTQHFGHAMDGARSGVEADLDEVAGGKLVRQLKQTTVHRNRLKFCALPLTIFGHYRGRDRSIEVHTGRTQVGVGLGEVSHSRFKYAMLVAVAADYESTGVRAYAWTWADVVLPVSEVCDNNGSNFPACTQ